MMETEELYKLYLAHPKITKDTREDVSDSLYIGLKGENFDGNSFAMEALEKGARYAVVDDEHVAKKDARMIRVPDSLEALKKLANYHRSKLDIPVLAITGSNGKTTTKELVSAVLRKKYNVFSTLGNYNNHIGIPLSLLQVKGDAEFIVLEMGASAQKEIEGYCKVAQPDYGLITNIGKAHLEGFGGVEGVKKGKGELFDYLASYKGMAFVNLDERYLPEMAEKISRLYFYEQSQHPSLTDHKIQIELVHDTPNIALRVVDKHNQIHDMSSSLMGVYNFRNIMTAIAVGYYFDVPATCIKEAIASYRSTNNRSQIYEKNEVTYLLDAYNANPSSMESSLRTFVKMNEGKKGIIIGDMLELGPYSKTSHQAIIDLLKEMDDVSFVYLVGNEFKQTNFPDEFNWFENIEQLKEYWNDEKFEGYTVFLKGSRSMRLEKLLDF